MKIHIVSGGYFKNAPEKLIFENYAKRMKRPVVLHELNDRGGAVDDDLYETHIKPHRHIIMLDEHGTDMTSVAFAQYMQNLEHESIKDIVFLIGGANGFSKDLKSKSHKKIRFGSMTWPHMMVRVMVMEQIYRSQQINQNHPYHKA